MILCFTWIGRVSGAIYYDERDDPVSVWGMLRDPGDTVMSASGVLVHAVLEGG